MDNNRKNNSAKSIISQWPKALVVALYELQQKLDSGLYISGGTVRDWLLDRAPGDIDITVHHGATRCCHELMNILNGGVFVQLGTETEEAARVVWQGYSIDFSSFRKGAQSINEELCYRDFTINSMAIEFPKANHDGAEGIIDPLKGRHDLAGGILRNCRDAFVDDPLRMLRGYRLMAELGFRLSPDCYAQIHTNSATIKKSAAERVLYEFDRIMSTSAASQVIAEMARSDLLWHIFPELQKGVGVEQPGFHHEDVFHHNLLALACIDRVIEEPHKFFDGYVHVIRDYLAEKRNRRNLRWSALFHDLGKPVTKSSGTMEGDRITFYNHDRVGRQIFEAIAARLRMSNATTEVISKLVEMHMHPFHLSNVKRESSLSRKALLKICKKAGDELAGLFVLAMADSLAGQGEMKPPDMEEQLSQLFDEVQHANEQYVKPALFGEKLLTGHDLIEVFQLEPGPLFKMIFEDLEIARVEGEVNNREDAFVWLQSYLKTHNLHQTNEAS